MTIFDFMNNSPILTFFLLFLICNTIVRVTKVLFNYHDTKEDKENKNETHDDGQNKWRCSEWNE